MSSKVVIDRLVTGIPGLDHLLGGGLPEFSFNIIAGTPGSGKTTLAHQIMFSLANDGCRALFFTAMGEPTLKMLRYQQQFSFFDSSRVNRSIHYVNLADDLITGSYEGVLARIAKKIHEYAPRLVFVDSFRSLADGANQEKKNISGLQRFALALAQEMTGWHATSFLIGEYSLSEEGMNPLLTVADGILLMSQNVLRNSMVRKIQAVKMRGQAQTSGLHTFRINSDGLNIFPSAFLAGDTPETIALKPRSSNKKRLSMGVPELDQMMGGGLPSGYSLLLVGPSGSGKTILATEFLAEGARTGEPGVVAAFEKSPRQLLSRKLDELVRTGAVGVIDTRSPDLSIDEALYEITSLITEMQASRVVIDSLTGFEMALAPEFREEYRESLYRMISVLTAMGVTILMTAELEDRYTDLRFSSYGNAFLADAIVLQRYVELGGQVKRVISVIKVRESDHSKNIHFFDIFDDEVKIEGDPIKIEGILSGHPKMILDNAVN